MTDIFPEFAKILRIFVVHNIKFFVFEVLKSVESDEHYSAYLVQGTGVTSCIPYIELLYKWPQLTFFMNRRLYVSLYGCDCV